ncbi:helix-turn-helix domain-containing protein [Corynebacterium flavescens]|uniref:PucR C-terminal helix-turn-helix domain-containing protein n=1 Tax=Corynebacterium flavescens TaxID=28028 RepID=A0AB73BAF1_CORFL|nr:helix-turn-helix domain-containing protein [Corynebacterium flavescens]KAA8725308.1 PucR family transcriptional regulator [Corynebacterium flavescens]GEB98752.1 hypothetical protein CFL01nite_22470 [Corynebacterium flavescens]
MATSATTPTPARLRISDLLLVEPRLKLVGTIKGSGEFQGLCAEEDGAGEDWLVFPSRTARPLEAARRLTTAAGLVFVEGETLATTADSDGSTVPTVPPTQAAPTLAAVTTAAVEAAASAPATLLLATGGMTRLDVRAAVDQLLRRQPHHQAWRKLQTIAHLSQALMSQSPESALLASYASLSGDALLLLDLDGHVLASAGMLPSRTIARALHGESGDRPSMMIGRWNVAAQLIAADATRRATGQAWWLVCGRRTADTPNVEDPGFVALRELLLGVLTARRHMEHSQLADSSVLLASLCAESSDKDELERSLIGRGFSRRAHLRLLVAGTAKDAFRSEIVSDIAGIGARYGIPLLVGYRKGRTLVLTTDSDALSQLTAALPAPVGISARFLRVGQGPRACREASVAAIVAEKKSAHSVRFDDCGAIEKAAALLGEEALSDAVGSLDAAIGEVKDGAAVCATWEEENFSVAKAAKRLGMHANTVRNRIEALSGQISFHEADLVLWSLWRKLVSRER